MTRDDASPDRPTHIIPVRAWRVWVVALLALFIVAGHAVDIGQQREHWPFSYYPMYGRVQKKPVLQMLGLYAIVSHVDDPGRTRRVKIPDIDAPVGDTRMRNILMAAWGRDGTGYKAQSDTAAVLRDYLRMYESRRALGETAGPALLEVQLCRATWRLKQGATSRKPREIVPLLGVRPNGKILRYDSARVATPSSTTAPATRPIDDDDDKPDPPPAPGHDPGDDMMPGEGAAP